MAVRCLVLDVDGVLTDGQLQYGPGDEPRRRFHVHDGLGIRWFRKLAGPVAILTAKRSEAVTRRAEELQIDRVVQGSTDKRADLERLLADLEVELSEAAFMGDDLADLPAMLACGCPLAPANAVAEVRRVARFVSKQPGGSGAVREAIEWLLGDAWKQVVQHYRGHRDEVAAAESEGPTE